MAKAPNWHAETKAPWVAISPCNTTRTQQARLGGAMLVQMYRILVRFVIFKSAEISDTLEDELNQLKKSNI